MKIKLNINLGKHKKGKIIDLDLCSRQEASYWRRSIKDSKIDKSVSIITDKEIEEENKIRTEKNREKLKKQNEAKEKALKDAKLKINEATLPVKEVEIEVKIENPEIKNKKKVIKNTNKKVEVKNVANSK